MIAGLHVLLYAEDAAAARAFFRDVIGWEALDPGDGWLYLTLPPAELAVHPGPGRIEGREQGRTEVFLMTTDVHATRAELEAKGVGVRHADPGRGLGPDHALPRAGLRRARGMYEPRHPSPLPVFGSG